MTKRRRSGFTLIEVLIVVVIMAILAATIIPQFSSSTKDAQTATVNFNAHTLRSQIELYRANHLSNFPTITGNSLPQLTSTTDVNGNIGTGVAFAYGPYLDGIPANPFNSLATIGPVATPRTAPTTGDGKYGYEYDVTTGNIYPDHIGWVYVP
jgi:prepilin-type N-terminal cleavage/methylation domain-containing protein